MKKSAIKLNRYWEEKKMPNGDRLILMKDKVWEALMDVQLGFCEGVKFNKMEEEKAKSVRFKKR